MTDRLVELIAKYFKKINPNSNYIIATQLAGHLRNNGVTFAEDNNVPCKWIPVSERLPDESGLYLVYERIETMKRWITNFDREVGKFGNWWDTAPKGAKYERCVFLEMEVTHWMPLPEPPKEGE